VTDETTVGIHAFGGYVPRRRLPRAAIYAAVGWFNPSLKGLARGERAMACWDEDAITLAVEAARDCLGNRDRHAITRVTLASTSHPNLDRQNSSIVKEALNLADTTAAFDIAGSQRAGTSALMDALHAASGGAGELLCIAAERGRQRAGSEAEMSSGHGAAAFVVGRGAGVARLLGLHSVTVDFVDHFRAAGAQFDYFWEARWIREAGFARIAAEAVRTGLRRAKVPPERVNHFILPALLAGANTLVAKAVGIRPEAVSDVLADRVGDTGAAHPLVVLSQVLERAQAGEILVVGGFGGGCDVLILETTAALDGQRPATGIGGAIEEGWQDTNYLRYLSFAGLIDLERGMRSELDQKPVLSALYRERKGVLGLIGGRCRKTGTVQFPKSPVSVSQEDWAVNTQEDYPLADRQARVVTYTADHLTYCPDPPAYYGSVEFEGGGRMMAEFADIGTVSVEVGTPMRMVFRIKATDEQRGFTKYFWKATPDRRRLSGAAPRLA